MERISFAVMTNVRRRLFSSICPFAVEADPGDEPQGPKPGVQVEETDHHPVEPVIPEHPLLEKPPDQGHGPDGPDQQQPVEDRHIGRRGLKDTNGFFLLPRRA